MEVGTVQRIDIEQKMRSAYLSYAMSVITARALPDVRDGLKPVQRRILYAMHDMGLRPDRPTRKSARIVGEVLGKYHPHGDTAVYDAMVRMAQDFSMRYPLVDGQGNFGSIDGDGAAAMRYTEARLTAIGEELLIDLDKDTVDFVDNFDASLQEPAVLPAKLPNLLLNGVGGIAVGMATNIPPHNLGEISDAIAYLVDNYERAEDVTLDDLMRFVQGPDFPTGGMILGSEGIRQAYATGKGRIVVRALAHVEEMRGGHQAVVVTELPYQVNKSNLVERIAKLVRDERLEGIGDLRDESDRTGMRIVMELKRGAQADPVMEQLLKYTQLETTFGANMLALVDGEPRLLPLKRVLLHYIDHRYDVLVRRTRFELERALARAHILEGLLIALDNLDEVIATIRRSRTADTARTNLIRRFKLSEAQAQAILDMQLRRLAALEQQRIQEEYEQILGRIEYLRELLASKGKMLGLVKEDILALKKAYGDPRRTRICETDIQGEFKAEQLVPDEDVCVLLTAEGLVRRLPASAYSSRRTNVPGMYARERDALAEIFVAHSQERVVFFTDKGNAYALPAHQMPDASQQEGGLPLADLVHLENDEQVIAMVHLPDEDEDLFVSMATRGGQVKRLALSELEAIGRAGTVVIGLADEDHLGWALPTRGADELIMVTEQGNAIRFGSDTVRPQGRSASGMRGISLKEDDRLAGVDVVREGGDLLILTALGFAKRTPLSEYNVQGRGGQGALTIDPSKSEVSGPVVDARVVLPEDEIVLTTTGRDMQRLAVSDVPRLARSSWGRLVTRTRRNAVIQVENERAIAAVRLTSSSGGEKYLPEPSEEQASDSGNDGASAAPSRPRGRRATTSSPARQAAAEDSAGPEAPTTTRRSSRRSRSQGAAQATSAPAPAEVEAPPKKEPQTATTRRRRSRRTSASEAKAGETQPATQSDTAASDKAPDSGTPKTAVTRRSRTRTVRKPPTRSRTQTGNEEEGA